MQAGDVVLLKHFGPATLVRLYPHRESKEEVWDVRAHSGESLHLSQRYVWSLEIINEAEV